MNSSAQFIRVAGRALPARKTSVLRLLDVQIRAVVPNPGGPEAPAAWGGAGGDEPLPTNGDKSSLLPAALPGRQLYIL